MTNHIMIDLETLDNRPSAVITQIGLVAFNKDAIVDQLQLYVDAEDCQKKGLTIGADTVKWWFTQSNEARAHFKNEAERLTPALGQVIRFFNQHANGESKIWGNGESKIWGNGASFDNVILRNAFEAIDSEAPWKFWQDRCYRTIKSELKHIPADDFVGTKHFAVSDALHQSKHLIKIAKATGGFPL